MTSEGEPAMIHRSAFSFSSLALTSALSLATFACSESDPEMGTGSGGATGSGAPGGSGVVVDLGGMNSGPSGPNSSADTCGDTAFDACVGQSYEGERLPLDMYVLFDQSGSMLNDVGGMTRLQAVQGAVAEFLRSAQSAEIGVGIGYFGNQPIGEASCDPKSYAIADVAVTPDHERVIASLDRRIPTGETPTGPALSGACQYANDWKRKNPGRAVVILLVTDGVPEAPVSCGTGTCCPTLNEAQLAAAACAASDAGTPVYVLGVGPALGNLGSIARAGGTGAAYLVEDRDAATQVLAALNAIRGAAQVPCELEIPPAPSSSTLDYRQVNLSLSLSGGCDFQSLFYVERESECGADGGWFYDDTATPSSVKLCPTSCEQALLPNARLRFSVGCKTLLRPIH
jgi:Mg-chelatase subunit ChlD